jgi:urea carboxylase-associated protein 2
MTDPAAPGAPSADAGHTRARMATLRARYEALRAQGQGLPGFQARIAAVPRIPRAIPVERVRLDRVVPAGWYWQGRVPAGTCLRLENDRGTPGVACLLWNAADPSERLCVMDTVKVQWTTRLGRGRVLLSDMGRVLASLVEDTCGRHDAVLGAGPPRLDEASSPLQTRNGHENLLLAAAKLGLGPRDVHAPVTFFAPVRCDAGQRFGWDGSVSLAGTYLDLHAEMGLLVALSNMPHPLAPPSAAAAEVRLKLWQPEDSDVSGFCRTATEEVQRSFAETRAYVAQRNTDGRRAEA